MKKLTIPSYTKVKTSNTNVEKFVDRKGDWTHYWLKKEKRFVPAVHHIMKHGFNKGKYFEDYLLDITRSEAEKKLQETGNRGSRVHDAVRRIIGGQTIDLKTLFYNEELNKHDTLTYKEQDNLSGFIAWAHAYKPEVIAYEHTIYNIDYGSGYAGTTDFFGTILVPEKDKSFASELWGKRILAVLDWKTGKDIYDEHQIQVAAYWEAIVSDYKSIETLIEKYGKVHTGIVLISSKNKCGYKMKTWDAEETQENFTGLLSAAGIYKLKTGGDDWPESVQLPTEFSFVFPKVKVGKKSKKLTEKITK